MEIDYNKEEVTYKIGGKIKKIDLTPVNEIRKTLEDILSERKNNSDRRHIDYSMEIMKKIEKLNKEQRGYLINSIVSLVTKYADLYQLILDNPEEECKKIIERRKILDFTKIVEIEIPDI